MKWSPEKIKLKAKSGEARLSSNCLFLHLPTDWYTPSAGKSSIRPIGLLKCLGYSEPRCSILGEITQAKTVIHSTPPPQWHGRSHTRNVTFFGNYESQVHINYLTKNLKMYPTHNVGTFFHLLKWFPEAQILYQTISNIKEFGYLLPNFQKKQILWNYSFKMFEDEIHNLNELVIAFSVNKMKLKVRSS